MEEKGLNIITSPGKILHSLRRNIAKSTYSRAEELVVDFGLSVSLHDVIAVWIEATVGRGGTQIYKPLQRGVYPVAPQLRREDEWQVSTYR